MTRQHNTRRDKTRQDKARHDKARQDKPREDKIKQDKTRQTRTRQDKARHDKTKQDKIQQDKTKRTQTRQGVGEGGGRRGEEGGRQTTELPHICNGQKINDRSIFLLSDFSYEILYFSCFCLLFVLLYYRVEGTNAWSVVAKISLLCCSFYYVFFTMF